MLSYQHEYHAGNHADVLKHALLTLVIRALQHKPGAIRVLDAHAGSGAYDLASREARRHAEHEQGIARLLEGEALPPGLEDYLGVVRAMNRGRSLRFYPGSPALARGLLRPADHLELLELHPRAVAALRRRLGADPQVHVHRRDCFEGLPALCPPPERRGVALIDPSYEVREDFARVAALLVACHRRWPGGVFMIWYPLLAERTAQRFPERIAATGIRRIYRAELQVQAADFPGLRGSGLLVVNLPFGLEERLAALLPWLAGRLAVAGPGRGLAHWLVPE
ncbi:MAG: 23S rRNA (adenine(2030)-N(6))-methyltransferase RlmJ [Gammaproteobacteria bacterium]|nr:MAG: 23S rRNA (adenine(2030)-N(6))-methyltransferase RlmJ [Gammaproteobacteria bacterium]